MDQPQTTIVTSTITVVPPLALPEETCSVRLSERDAEAILAAAEHPPAPNEAALQAAKWFLEQHG